MKSWSTGSAIVLTVAVLCAGSAPLMAQETPKIPGAGSGGMSAHESVIEGTLDKYDSVLNKLTIKGIDEDRMTLDAVPSLKAKEGTHRIPMAIVKQGQKIRVIYTEKGKKKIAKDVEIVKDEELPENGTKKAKPERPEKGDAGTPRIPGAD